MAEMTIPAVKIRCLPTRSTKSAHVTGPTKPTMLYIKESKYTYANPKSSNKVLNQKLKTAVEFMVLHKSCSVMVAPRSSFEYTSAKLCIACWNISRAPEGRCSCSNCRSLSKWCAISLLRITVPRHPIANATALALHVAASYSPCNAKKRGDSGRNLAMRQNAKNAGVAAKKKNTLQLSLNTPKTKYPQREFPIKPNMKKPEVMETMNPRSLEGDISVASAGMAAITAPIPKPDNNLAKANKIAFGAQAANIPET
mmetsp:Transcript_23809/g.34777  ORF Transcript_23809/g.34777 Transcript_23809/m.34777 type:complete len:255 (+) Transcript_23809:707-1471(+)